MRNNEERFGANPTIQDATPPQLTQNTPLDFIVPTEFVELPSKGKFYPAGHPLRNKDVIEIKQMTAKEEDLLTSKSLIKKGVVLDKLLQSLIVNKAINPDTITLEDRSAIVIAARISAYGADYNTSVTCPQCSQKNKHTFNLLEKTNVEEESAEFKGIDIDDNGFFNILLPATKWNITCRALIGFDEKTLLNATESKKSSANDSIFLEQLRTMIVAIQGVTDRASVSNAILNMPASDTRYLKREYQKLVVPYDIKQNFACSSCDFEAIMEVPLSADFFWFK